MEYRQTRMALVVKAITLWWWFGVALFFIPIVIDLLKFKRTRLVLNEKSVTLYDGILTENSQDLPYRNIQTVNVHQSVLGQMFGYGHIVLSTAHSGNGVMFKYVDKPQILREMIQARIKD